MVKRKRIKISRQLKESLESALAFERGQPVDVRVTELPAAPKQLSPGEIKQIRHALNASQALFATLLNVSPKAVQSWEQGARRPTSAALKLLILAKKNPRVLLVA